MINGGTVYAYNHGIGPDSGSYVSFVPAAAIGGGSASTNTGNKDTYVEINGGFVYAQSKGGVAIGGGGSGTQTGGKATVNISGGTVIAKSVGGEVNYDKKGVGKNHTETITPGVSIGGGTGATGGGSVKLTISGENTILRTGSIGGGKTTGSGNIGSANVTITGGDITGQVIMAGGASSNCSFTMSGGRIHDTDVVNGNTITDTNIVDPQKDVKISYIEKNGGAVWMEDPNGVTEISGGTIEGCTAELGGAIYMTGGNFTLSGEGNISGNKATAETTSTDPETPAADTSVKGLGGAVYISNGTVDITGGTMGKDGKPNRAVNGAGVYVNDGTVNVSGGNIQFNSASINGGGLYVTGGNVNVSGGKIDKNTAGERGGGVYLAVGGSFTMEGKDAVISNNKAENGGGIYLYTSPILQEGSITENIATKNGGGMYIYDCLVELSPKGDVYITNNSAVDGAGIYIHEKTAADATGGETVGETGGETGGETSGETEADSDPDTTVTYDAISNATPEHKVGLRLSDKTEGHFYFIGNKATKSGGAVCIDIGRFYLDTDNVTITNNKAENGGGVAVLSGNFTMSAGSIGQENGANTATNGGGVYVSSGEAYLRGGRVEYNEADYGGGVYVDAGDATIVGGRVEYNTAVNDGGGVYVRGEDEKGELKMESGTLSSNIANNDGGGFYVDNGNFIMGGSSGSDPSGNASGDGDGETPGTTSPEAIISGNIANAHGGGGYVAGDFLMLNGTIGGAGGTNQANSGGGIYVSDGNVTIVYGIIEHNYAINDGGGFLVSAVKNDVQVKMLSGSLSSNKAGNSGGGMAVETSEGSAKKITVEIGCLLDHKIDSTNKPNLPIDYTDTYIQYNKYGQHKSCPIVKNNTAEEIGGGFFMNSSGSTLSFYCVEEGGNIANAKDNSASMDVEGGKVVIGDENYHNHEYNEKQPDKQSVPYGYISMDNATLVNGGQVDIYGDMTNPIFKDEVTVDIENKDTDHFLDHRRAHKFEQRYKVHYIENFQGTGLYQAYQYEDSEAVITIKGALYSHPGYSIVGWYTKSVYDPTQPDKDHQFYEVGDTFDLRDPNTVPQLGKQTINCDKCGETVGDSNLLELYAIWEANGYIVHFDPNVPDGETYTGSMENQILQYGVEANLSENGYKYMGHFFAGWATSPNPDLNPNPGPDPVPDGSSIPYPDKAQVLNLTDKKGATVVLYAQWKPCDHKDPTRWSYRVEGKAIIRDCSCGGQTLSAALIAEDTVYDGFEHPAKLVCTDEDKIAWGNDLPDIAYTSKWLEDGLTHTGYGPELSVDGKPFHAGVYTASITKVNMTVDSNGVTVEVPVTAKIDYIISKADQEQPEKPTYTTPTESQAISSLNVNRLDNDPAILIDAMNRFNEAKAQYRVSYYSNSGFVSTEWQYYSDNVDKTITINLPAAYTSYFVEARYEELDDYNPSDIVRADAVYYFTGNVKVIVECDEGIQYNLAPMKEEGSIAEDGNGLKLDLTTKEGYYLVSDNYTIGCTAVKDDNAEIQAPTITPE